MKKKRSGQVCVLYVLLDLYAALACAALPSPAAPPPPPDPRIPRLIADLASDDFARRDAASKSLVEAGDAAVPALEAAAKDPSPEVQARARAALKAIEDRKIRPEKVLEILYGSAAFVEGGGLALRDALKPVERLGLRVDYDAGVDPAQPCSLTKHGQTALELVDQLAETGGVGIRIVPGGVRVVTKDGLSAFYRDQMKRLEATRIGTERQISLVDIMKSLLDSAGVYVVPYPGVKIDMDLKIHLQGDALNAYQALVLNLILRDPDDVRPEWRYGLLVLVQKPK